MTDERLCIICDVYKPESQFEKKGEHIVPRTLGNRKYRTPFVCKDCNNGLGGTVDAALKNVPGVALACYDRGIGGARENIMPEHAPDLESILVFDDYPAENQHARKPAPPAPSPLENPDVKGGVLKIAYEAAHLRLGNNWLREPAAAAFRDVLFAYVNRDKKKAYGLMDSIAVHEISIGTFYHAIGKSRGEHVKHAIVAKSCLNALWLAPVKTPPGNTALAVVYDIEGLPPGYVKAGDSNHGIEFPELLSPKIK